MTTQRTIGKKRAITETDIECTVNPMDKKRRRINTKPSNNSQQITNKSHESLTLNNNNKSQESSQESSSSPQSLTLNENKSPESSSESSPESSPTPSPTQTISPNKDRSNSTNYYKVQKIDRNGANNIINQVSTIPTIPYNQLRHNSRHQNKQNKQNKQYNHTNINPNNQVPTKPNLQDVLRSISSERRKRKKKKNKRKLPNNNINNYQLPPFPVGNMKLTTFKTDTFKTLFNISWFDWFFYWCGGYMLTSFIGNIFSEYIKIWSRFGELKMQVDYRYILMTNPYIYSSLHLGEKIYFKLYLFYQFISQGQTGFLPSVFILASLITGLFTQLIWAWSKFDRLKRKIDDFTMKNIRLKLNCTFSTYVREHYLRSWGLSCITCGLYFFWGYFYISEHNLYDKYMTYICNINGIRKHTEIWFFRAFSSGCTKHLVGYFLFFCLYSCYALYSLYVSVSTEEYKWSIVILLLYIPLLLYIHVIQFNVFSANCKQIKIGPYRCKISDEYAWKKSFYQLTIKPTILTILTLGGYLVFAFDNNNTNAFYDVYVEWYHSRKKWN